MSLNNRICTAHNSEQFLLYLCSFLNCLLASEAGAVTSPGVYLRDDPICGTQLENQSELRAPTAERAAYFLDAAIAARTIPGQYLYNTATGVY